MQSEMLEGKLAAFRLEVASERATPKLYVRGDPQATYPLVWLGEKTKPYLYGQGRLVEVAWPDGSRVACVQRLTRIAAPRGEPPIGQPAIVLGGVPPTLWAIEAVEWGLREYFHGREGYLIPSGLGFKTWALKGSEVALPDTPLEEFEGELYEPPYAWWVALREGGAAIKLLTPLE